MNPQPISPSVWDDILSFSKINPALIYSIRGICGVNKYIGDVLNLNGIYTLCEFMDLFRHFKEKYGHKCNDKLGLYLDEIGVANPRRMIIISTLEKVQWEQDVNVMRLKPHRVFDGYF